MGQRPPNRSSIKHGTAPGSINAAIATGGGVAVLTATGDPEMVDPELSFQNLHDKAAASTRQGSLAIGLFQYPDRSYGGRLTNVEGLSECTACHDPHSLKIDQTVCAACHGDRPSTDIRARQVDWDGDGYVATGVAVEIASVHAMLGQAIASYASATAGAPLVHDGSAYPCFFNDSNGDGAASADEATYPNRYQSWTPRLPRAAYTYRFVAKGGCAGADPALRPLHSVLAAARAAIRAAAARPDRGPEVCAPPRAAGACGSP